MRVPLLLLSLALSPALFLAVAPCAGAQALTLEQIMADPDWIGPAVENPYWSLDGTGVQFELKRAGSPLRDLYGLPVQGGAMQPVDDAGRAGLDAPDPVYDARRERALFVRNGDVFLRDLRSGVLQQLTRSEASESHPQFQADGGHVAWRLGNDWYLYELARGVGGPATVLKLEPEPDAADEDAHDEDLRRMQLRLIGTLARERDKRQAQRSRENALRRIDPTRTPPPFHLGDAIEIADSALSPDGRWMLLVTQDKEHDAGRKGQMPRYVTESGYNEVEDVRTRVGRNPPQGQKLVLLDLRTHTRHGLAIDPLPGIGDDPLAQLRTAAGEEPMKAPRGVRVEALRFSHDGADAAVMLRAVDNKDRWIARVDFDARRLVPAHRLTDPAWINWNFNEFGFLPGTGTLWFVSEESGYGHLYTQRDRARPRPLTSGRWEVYAPQPTPDGLGFHFIGNRDWPGDYELFELRLDDGAPRALTALDGVERFALSPDARRVLVSYSGSYLPMQLAVVDLPTGEIRRLTDTRSQAFRAIDWMAPEFVQVPSSHVDRPLWSKLYLPPSMQPDRSYPVVMFVHGAGYTQNVHAKYPYYFREQMFHNLLAHEGYIVLDIDYRASEGYGRDWRTAIYRQMGHPELEDYLDGIDWLVAHHQADRSRVGIYGGSYGGFMTFMAMFRAPEAFRAGAALRPVTDWSMYNHEYTSNILNTPGLDPEAYAKSSPIEFAEGLQGALLIAHGMLDDNVFYQDSVRLAQRLIELGKRDWELASYPLERHSFVHPESWLDEYRRIHELFSRTLRPDAPAARSAP
ncbi:MAG TPA: S9 family peptidase [Xanthomonadaceae bacterium]|nr:S9 family peptidase [Xanthomonadaceae bacterium]